MQYPMSRNLHLDDEYELACFGCSKLITISRQEFHENMFNYCRKCMIRKKDMVNNRVIIVPPYHTQTSMAIDRELAKNPLFNY
jgi:hypothetical protein